MVVLVGKGSVLLVLTCLLATSLVPGAHALFPFRITVHAPDVAVVGDETEVVGRYFGSVLGAPDRPVWLMRDGVRIDETVTDTNGFFVFVLPWPTAGRATYQVIGDPFSALETRSERFVVLGLDAPAAPPVAVDVVDQAWGQVEVRWEPGVAWPGSEREAWRVYRATGTSDDWQLLAELPTATTALLDAVETGTWYTYAVGGWNRVGPGERVEELHRAAGPNTTAASPDQVSATLGDSWRRVVLTWPPLDPPLGQEAASLQVFRRPAAADASWSFLGEVSPSETRFDDRVDLAGAYEYAVRGWNRFGAGPLVNTTFTFALPKADDIAVGVSFVRVCWDGWNAGYRCRDMGQGDRWFTYDDARIVAMRPLIAYDLTHGGTGVAEAPIAAQMELTGCSSKGGCETYTMSRGLETDMAGEGKATFLYGSEHDPVRECIIVYARPTVEYQQLTAMAQLSFEICD